MNEQSHEPSHEHSPDPSLEHSPEQVLHFWFNTISPKDWWAKDLAFDGLIRDQYQALLMQAVAAELSHWRTTSQGRLAEIVVLDQFSRNIYRDTPQAFAADGQALMLAQEAIAAGCLTDLAPEKAAFLLMPYMHSESGMIHRQAVALFQRFAPKNLDFELRHKAIIDQFGRYPHRNAILGRPSSQAEIAFLQQPGSSF